MVLDPSKVWKINQLFRIVNELRSGSAQVSARLSAEGFELREVTTRSAPILTLEQMLGPNLKQLGRADDMLLAAELNFNKPSAPQAPADGTLGAPQLLWDRLTGWFKGVSPVEALRRALLDWLEKDKSFDFSDRDDTFKQVSGSIGPAVDFTITGHTHLERAIEAQHGHYYFNSGTWIRLLCFTPEILTESVFDQVYKVLTDGSMEAIDRAEFGGKPFVLDQSSAVSICEQNGSVVGSLTHVEGDGTGAPRAIQSFVRS